ncbi:uncharacterized protein V6R79_007702 [Siganus canaliculatus]
MLSSACATCTRPTDLCQSTLAAPTCFISDMSPHYSPTYSDFKCLVLGYLYNSLKKITTTKQTKKKNNKKKSGRLFKQWCYGGIELYCYMLATRRNEHYL